MTDERFTARRRLVAARTIAQALRPAENALDTSIVESASLIGAIAKGRLETGVAAETGHAALMDAIGAMTALGQARALKISCHQRLAVTRDDFAMSGPQVGCTPGKYPSGEIADERLTA